MRVGSCELEVIGIVGHTDGSIALAYDDPDGIVHLFTGDSLFPGGVGKTWSADDFATLIDDVETKLFDRFDGRHLGVSRPWQRHDTRRRASSPRRVARTRLVAGAAKHG